MSRRWRLLVLAEISLLSPSIWILCRGGSGLGFSTCSILRPPLRCPTSTQYAVCWIPVMSPQSALALNFLLLDSGLDRRKLEAVGMYMSIFWPLSCTLSSSLVGFTGLSRLPPSAECDFPVYAFLGNLRCRVTGRDGDCSAEELGITFLATCICAVSDNETTGLGRGLKVTGWHRIGESPPINGTEAGTDGGEEVGMLRTQTIGFGHLRCSISRRLSRSADGECLQPSALVEMPKWVLCFCTGLWPCMILYQPLIGRRLPNSVMWTLASELQRQAGWSLLIILLHLIAMM